MRRERSVNPVVRRQLDLIQHAAKGGMLPVLDLDPGATSELADCQRALHIVRNQPAAGGQTEFPNGFGRLALRAYEEKRWRAGSPCRCPRRMAGDLLSGGRGQLDDHDRDYALQRLAAVSPLAAGQRCAAQPNASSTRLKAGCCRFFTLTQCGDRPLR
jgi:hypothetical protein